MLLIVNSFYRRIYQPRGRVWGGSSSLNAMVYIRGHAYDYDDWEKQGAKGWSYADCLPYFRKSQTHELGKSFALILRNSAPLCLSLPRSLYVHGMGRGGVVVSPLGN